MARIVLATDYTLMSNYRELPLSTFFSCIPADAAPSRLAFRILANEPPHVEGVAKYAPYGVRKLEAALLKGTEGYRRDEVVVAHPRFLHKFIGPDTEVVALSTMDPLGMGPVSMTFTNGGQFEAYTKHEFLKLARAANGLPYGANGHNGHGVSGPARGRRYKLVVGGPGVWQFEHQPKVLDQLGIDHVVSGECDVAAPHLLRELAQGRGERVIRVKDFPRVEEMPDILGPAMHGMVEVMRGCGRNCEFCDVNLRRARDYPVDKVLRDVRVNVEQGGFRKAWLHSDDIFLYRCEDRATLEPNVDAVCELFQAVMDFPGIAHCNPTHGTLSPNVSHPQMTERLTRIVRGAPDKWIGIQSGVETGSPELMRKFMPRKALPLSVNDWQDIIVRAVEHLNANYWYPAMTVIVGLPGELPEDAWETVRLLFRLEHEIASPHFIIAPLCFVPVGVLRDKGFYRVDEQLDEARYNVIYHCWRHTVREMDQSLWLVSRMPAPVKAVVNLLGRAGGRWIMWGLEKYARERGFVLKQPRDFGFS